MLLKLLRETNPDYLVVAFDLKGPTTRHGEFGTTKPHANPCPMT